MLAIDERDDDLYFRHLVLFGFQALLARHSHPACLSQLEGLIAAAVGALVALVESPDGHVLVTRDGSALGTLSMADVHRAMIAEDPAA